MEESNPDAASRAKPRTRSAALRAVFMIGAVVLPAGLLFALMFVGIEEDALLLPAATVRIVDGGSGEPLAGASVTVVRAVQYPHFMGPENVWSASADAVGTASFEHQLGQVTQHPFFPIHGTRHYLWQACAEADGYESQAFFWFSESYPPTDHVWEDVVHGRARLEREVSLSPGDREPCEEILQEEQHPPMHDYGATAGS